MAQTVDVTGTITDTQLTPYSNGLLTITFVNSTGQLATFGGNPSFQKSYSVFLDANGAFTVKLPPNSTVSPSIQPAGTQWNFSYQSQGGYGAANVNITITSSGSISGTLSNLVRITWPYGNIPPPGSSGQGIVFVTPTTLGWGAAGLPLGTTVSGANIKFPGALTSNSTMISIDSFEAKADSGVTDNTMIINNAIAGLADGVDLLFPCGGGGTYNVTGQIVFKGHHGYIAPPQSSSSNACALVSSYSGNDAAFLFVDAGYVNISGLRFHSNNSASPPWTIATFGRSAGPTNGSNYTLDHAMFDGYASKVGVYNVGSEVLDDFGSTFTLNGGGALYTYYTTTTDDLGACTECVANSNTAQWHYGSAFIDYSGTTTIHYTIGFGGTTRDILFSGGYAAPQVTGGVTYGHTFRFNASPYNITIEGIRSENAISFVSVAASTSPHHINVLHNTLSIGGPTGTTNFIDGSAGSITFAEWHVEANYIKTNAGEDYLAGVGDTYSGTLVASYINEPFSVSGAVSASPGSIICQATSTLMSCTKGELETFTGPNGASATGPTFSSCETSAVPTVLSTVATTTDTGLNCLPANAIIDAVTYRITTTITTAANFTIGDATTAARFCSTQSVLTTGTRVSCFAQADQTGAAGPKQTSAAAVRITTNVNPGAGALRIIVYYHTWAAATG